MRRQIYKLMIDNGFVLIRSGHHDVWQRPLDGAIIVTSKTSSDERRVINNIKGDIRKANRKITMNKAS